MTDQTPTPTTDLVRELMRRSQAAIRDADRAAALTGWERYQALNSASAELTAANQALVSAMRGETAETAETSSQGYNIFDW